MEYSACLSEEDADKIAVQVVTADLKDDPSIFNQDFIVDHINMDKLKEWVLDSERESDYARELAADDPKQFYRTCAQFSIGVEDEAEPPTEDEIDALTEALAKDRASDPMAYLSDFYTAAQITAKAIEIAGIDIPAAAECAVSADGSGHFLSRYDGHLKLTAHGYAYWREN